jgi:hypothetical protein
MFSWFKKKQPPPPFEPPKQPGGNPGIGTKARLSLSNGERSWTEEIDVVDSAAKALTMEGHVVECGEESLLHSDSGLIIKPQLVGLQLLENGIQTVTTVEVRHPEGIPGGLFEYQHSTGDNSADSLEKGFSQWAQIDFVVLLEALRDHPESCTTMELEFPAIKGVATKRRAILGPVAHMATDPRDQAAEAKINEEHPPFCTCCLLTNSFEAFKPLVEDDRFYGIRFFAARDEQGVPQADCRVNGEDFPAGAAALRKYAATWPAAGYEFRKQYVVLRSVVALPNF